MTKATGPAAPRWMDRRTAPHLATLVMVAGLAALNMNMILPALPSLAGHFEAEYTLVALTVSGYLALTGLLQLLIGPMSDRYGRRPVILWTFAIFLLATLGCVLAPNIWVFLGFRMLQSTVASGIVLSRAIVRDTVTAQQAVSQIAYVTMGMSLMPMLSPMLGGFLAEAFGWRAIMIATLIFGMAVFALVWFDLGETNTAPSASLGAQLRAYPQLFGSTLFWGYALSAAFASGAFFAFLGGGPWVAIEVLGMSPSALGFYFGLIALGYLIGNFLSGRHATRIGPTRMMVCGGVVAAVGVGMALGLSAVGSVSPPLFFLSLAFVGLGNGLVLPSANAGMVSVRPRLAGSASGLGGALMIGGGAVMSVIAGALLGPDTGAWPLLWLMLISTLLGLGATMMVLRLEQNDGD